MLSENEIVHAREGLHNQLLNDFGINHYDILEKKIEPPNVVRNKSVSSKIFYNKWKIDILTNYHIYKIYKELMNNTFSSSKLKGYEHPFGYSDDVVPFIDKICWRLPDTIQFEGGLSLHIDRNPLDPYLLKFNRLKRFRPIQSFISLTDSYGSNGGGLKVIKGFHKIIDDYFSKDLNLKNDPSLEAGEFFRLHSKKYAKLLNVLEPVNVPRGSLVLWDNRLPHATCDYLDGFDTREVVYLSYIPNIELNKKYHTLQSEHLIKNYYPPVYFENKNQFCDLNFNINTLSEFQKNILGIKN